MKSEPEAYSIDDLECQRVGMWDGVRNYQARNFMRDEMRIGDQVLFYHSRANPPGVAGIAEVASVAYPDPTQFDPASDYYDPKATKEKPRWYLVDVRFKKKFATVLPLARLKKEKMLHRMELLRPGQRLSIMPVRKAEFQHIVKMATEHMDDIRINGIYEHYKGNRYRVIGVARHSETHEQMVVYQGVYDSEEFGPQQLWVRPYGMFTELVTVAGVTKPRFRLVTNE